MEDYVSLVKKKKFIGAQPITLTKKTFKQDDYFLTEKLDGKRHLLFISSQKVFTITSKLEFKEVKLTKYISTLENTILDCELYNKKFYVFDILFYKGDDMRSLKFKDRIQKYNMVIKTIKSKKLISKNQQFINKNELCKEVNTIVKRLTPMFKEGDLDGIILTPDDVYYSTIFKYKPSHLLSIDFKIKKKDGHIFLLLLQNGQLFKPKGKYKDIGIVHVTKTVYDKYNDDSVVEFIFKNGSFYPIRARPDKITSNALFVVLDNFKLMISGDDLKSIIC